MEGENAFTLEMFTTMPDGTEVKNMVVHLTRGEGDMHRNAEHAGKKDEKPGQRRRPGSER